MDEQGVETVIMLPTLGACVEHDLPGRQLLWHLLPGANPGDLYGRTSGQDDQVCERDLRFAGLRGFLQRVS